MRAHIGWTDFGRSLDLYMFEDDTHVVRITEVMEDGTIVVISEEAPEGVRVEPTLRFGGRASEPLVKAMQEFLGQQNIDTTTAVPLSIFKAEQARVDKLLDFAISPPQPPTAAFRHDG